MGGKEQAAKKTSRETDVKAGAKPDMERNKRTGGKQAQSLARTQA